MSNSRMNKIISAVVLQPGLALARVNMVTTTDLWWQLKIGLNLNLIMIMMGHAYKVDVKYK